MPTRRRMRILPGAWLGAATPQVSHHLAALSSESKCEPLSLSQGTKSSLRFSPAGVSCKRLMHRRVQLSAVAREVQKDLLASLPSDRGPVGSEVRCHASRLNLAHWQGTNTTAWRQSSMDASSQVYNVSREKSGRPPCDRCTREHTVREKHNSAFSVNAQHERRLQHGQADPPSSSALQHTQGCTLR